MMMTSIAFGTIACEGHTHIHTRTHTHTYTHTHSQPHTHIHTYTRTHAHGLVYVNLFQSFKTLKTKKMQED